MSTPNVDHKYLDVLRDYYAKHRYLPSYAKISELLGFSARNAAFVLVRRLMLAGYLKQSPDRRLQPAPKFFELPLAGSKVAAGLPGTMTEDVQDAISIEEHLVRQPSRTVLVTVKGDSMIDAGILPGDIVVVEKRHAANAGDIVIAIVDNEFTVKRLMKERGRFVLRPENKAYEVIHPKELEIFGVVVGSVRKY